MSFNRKPASDANLATDRKSGQRGPSTQGLTVGFAGNTLLGTPDVLISVLVPCLPSLTRVSTLQTVAPSKLAPSPPGTTSPGLPSAEVFTLKPLEFGKPNTLVCFISNLFPPTLTVTWQHHFVPVEGASPTSVSAIDGLTFQAFSYLNFTPEPFDLYSCTVTHEIDRYTAIAYWGEDPFLEGQSHEGRKGPGT